MQRIWISEAVATMSLGAIAKEMINIIHPHPTVSKAIHEAFHSSVDKAIHFIVKSPMVIISIKSFFALFMPLFML